MFSSPLEAITALVEARNAGNVERALQCYGPDAVVVVQPGSVFTGLDGARAALEAFVALRSTFVVTARKFIEGPDVALHYCEWTLTGTGQAGQPLMLTGRSTDVFRLQPGGGWLLVLDNPYGTSVLTS
jgi:ketosteroid isomerase-like protein